MPANFPTSLDTFVLMDTSNDGPVDPTIARADDYNKEANAISAVETELGVAAGANASLRGSKASLLARLAVSINPDGTLIQTHIQITTANSAVNLLAADSGKTVLNGGSGAPSGRPVNLPAPAAGLFFYIADKTGNGIRAVASSGAIWHGDATGTFVELYGRGSMLLECDGTDWIAHYITGRQNGLN